MTIELQQFNGQQLSSHSNWNNVQILNRIRMIAIIGQLMMVLVAVSYLDIRLPLFWIFGLILLEIIFQAFSIIRLEKNNQISQLELLVQIIFDSIILAGLVYFSGGANNPFIYLLLLPIALGTLMLSAFNLILIATLQLSLYSLINIFQRSLELGDASPLASFHLHLAGMWVNFVVTVILIATFGLLTKRSMIAQERKIQTMREKQIQDEQLLSLGIMSASAAHELGTPLSTMAIIVDDFKHQNLTNDLQQDIELLEGQIDRCRQIIQSLSDKSKQSNFQSESKVKTITLQLNKILEAWLVYQPKIKLIQNWSEDFILLKQNLSKSVEQAIINLLDNAADASLANSNDQVEITGYLQSTEMLIDILDFGCGITPEIKKNLGASVIQSKKQDGLGWGLFLSNASIERANGKVELLEVKGGGTLTRISLPLNNNINHVD